MPDVVKHAWTHRPKGQGGTDPVPMSLSWCQMGNGQVLQSVTDDSELVFLKNSSSTNDHLLFRFDPSDPGGLLVYEDGLYMAASRVVISTGDQAVEKSTYVMSEPLSSGPLGGLGNAFGDTVGFQLGGGLGDASPALVESGGIPNKSQLSYFAISTASGSRTAPNRFAVALIHLGVDYDLSTALQSTLTVVRLSPYAGVAPPGAPLP